MVAALRAPDARLADRGYAGSVERRIDLRQAFGGVGPERGRQGDDSSVGERQEVRHVRTSSHDFGSIGPGSRTVKAAKPGAYGLTAADISAVGPGVWNNWKAEVLADLHKRTMRHLAGESEVGSVERNSAQRGRVRDALGHSTDAAWFYPEPKDAAKEIAGRVAFWKGVKVVP